MSAVKIIQPESVADICVNLKKYQPNAVLHAGGTDLIVRIRNGSLAPACIIDLSKVASLNRIQQLSGNTWRIGCMTTLSDLIEMEEIRKKYHALCESLQLIGSVQIRNRATLIGNVCNASPAADSVPPLMLFDARVNIKSQSGERSEALEDFILGPDQTGLRVDEFVESIDLPALRGRCASAYARIGRRKSVDCSVAGVAVRLNDNGIVRVAFGAVAPVTFRAKTIEDLLSQNPWDAKSIEAAASLAEAAVEPIDDIRSSEAYRRHMSSVLFKRAFDAARSRLEKE